MKGYASMSVAEFVKSADIIRIGDKVGTHRLHKGDPDAKEFMDALSARKSEVMDYLLAQEAEAKRAAEARRANIAAIDGLDELIDAINASERYRDNFERMMDDEYNDGARPPKKPSADIGALKSKYPRAAAYLAAQDMSCAANDVKASAGRRALERIISGDDYEKALADAKKEWTDYCSANMD